MVAYDDGWHSGRAHQRVSMQGVVYRASCSRHDELLLLRERERVRMHVGAGACVCVCVCVGCVLARSARAFVRIGVVDGLHTMRAVQCAML